MQPVVAQQSGPKDLAPDLNRPPTVSSRTGWTCRSNEENDSWDCSLIGADPKGRAKLVGAAQPSAGWFAPTYDFRDEEIFRNLKDILPYDPWQNCTVSRVPRSEDGGVSPQREAAPVDVHADFTEVFDKDITSFFGNVEIRRADQHVTADRASYDTVSKNLDAQGHVYYSDAELTLYADTVSMNMESDAARLRNVFFISPSGPIRGSADVVYRDSKTFSRYADPVFTSCGPGNQDWLIHASRLKMNRAKGKGSAKNAWLEFKGVPVLYTPYIAFPLDDRRLSGFLPPSLGSSGKNGFDVEVPYYWNIAPNYDLIFTPRYLSKRGAFLRSEFRYLTSMSRGGIDLEYLPYDNLKGSARFLGSVQANTSFGYGFSSNLDLNYVSDDDYFNDLNNALGFSDTRHVRSQADVRYQNNWLNFVSRLENYQTIDRSIDAASRPYQKYPQIELNLDHTLQGFPMRLAMRNQYTYFFRNGRVKGQRFDVKPSISFPWEISSAFITPKISLQHTEYFLEDQAPGVDSEISRTLPIASVDGGLFFEKDVNVAGTPYVHSLEPRLFYLYIPRRDQSDIPLFDTALYDFSFYSLFRENRFNGPDRIQDANQLTIALTSRLTDSHTGEERLKLSLGDILYFQDREVVLRGTVPETQSFSNLVAEISGQLTNHLSFTSVIQWDPEVNDISRGQATLRYRNLPDKIINIGYRYRRDDPDLDAEIIQSDISFRWPVYDNWYAVGRWQYSLKFNQTVESFLGLENESCCWRFRILGRRFVNNISNSALGKAENGIFVQLELKGLGSFGDKVDNFLERNVFGYRKPDV